MAVHKAAGRTLDPAWRPVDYDLRTVMAVKAVAAGTASEQQQRDAIQWLVYGAAGTYEMSYRSDNDGGDRETAFLEGRRFVGLSVVKMIQMTPDAIEALRSGAAEKPKGEK